MRRKIEYLVGKSDSKIIKRCVGLRSSGKRRVLGPKIGLKKLTTFVSG